MRTALYRHFDADGALLYVGIAGSLGCRTKEHAASSPWVHLAVRAEAEWFASRADAEAAEREAIRAERPAFNQRHSDKGPNRVACDVTDLRSWMRATGTTQAIVAAHIGVSVPHLSKMMTGAQRPCFKTAWLIECATAGAVPMSAWTVGFDAISAIPLPNPPSRELAPSRLSPRHPAEGVPA